MSVPAWKKIGLKIKDDQESGDSLSITHLESATITNKQAKKLNKRKATTSIDSSNKKPPKRVKVPKSERPPPPEKDQLYYLRQYHTDRDNWKFSKQKQNWILKNIRNIPKDFETALVSYVEGLQGGSRDRMVEDLKVVVGKWNDIQAVAEAKVMAQLEKKRNGGKEEEKQEEKKEEKKDKKDEETKGKKKVAVVQEEEAPDTDYAKRCRLLIKTLTDEVVELRGIEEDDEDEEAPEESLSKKEEVAEVAEVAVEEEAQVENEQEEEEEEEKKVEEDNLIFDNVEVSGYPEEFENAKKSKAEREMEAVEKKAKKDKKKSKKAKKSKK